MEYIEAVQLALGLTAGNFIYQSSQTDVGRWAKAMDRSVFQWIAVFVTVYAIAS